MSQHENSANEHEMSDIFHADCYVSVGYNNFVGYGFNVNSRMQCRLCVLWC